MTTYRDSVYRTAARTGCAVAFSAALSAELGAQTALAQTGRDLDSCAAARQYHTGSCAYGGNRNGLARRGAFLLRARTLSVELGSPQRGLCTVR